MENGDTSRSRQKQESDALPKPPFSWYDLVSGRGRFVFLSIFRCNILEEPTSVLSKFSHGIGLWRAGMEQEISSMFHVSSSLSPFHV
jgi:hypothetical protein